MAQRNNSAIRHGKVRAILESVVRRVGKLGVEDLKRGAFTVQLCCVLLLDV